MCVVELEMPILTISVLVVGVSVCARAHVCFMCVFIWCSELEHRVFYVLLTELYSQALFGL